MAKAPELGQLNKMFQEAELIDKSIFAEQRSNILLIAGEHYTKRGRQFPHVRDTKDVVDQQKLRLTKNWTYKVHRRYTASILNYASGVMIMPQMDSELQDQKDAELNRAVWEDAKTRYRMREKIRYYASDFTGVGEVCVVMKWNPESGVLKGYGQALDPEGMPLFDENGDPVPDPSQPQFSGEFVFERVFGFNLLRAPFAQSMAESPYIIVRKMTPTKTLRDRYRNDEDKLKGITENATSEEFIVFDATRGGYDKSKDVTVVREFYFRPSVEYPEGYFVICTNGVILEEGPLPFGLFPVLYQGFDEHPTSPRGRSIIKQARPWQAEINRASSQQALHQITVADDKIIYQAGTKLAPGGVLPGVRGITYQGAKPEILPGRAGEQFQNYITIQTQEMLEALDVFDIEGATKEVKGSNDLYALLFRSAAHRQNYSIYSEKFEQFLVDFVYLFLEMARHYYPDDLVIPAIGAKEKVNLAEFRKTQAMHYRIKVVPQDDTLETRFGKQLTLQHFLQYAGQNMNREDLGRVARAMPFANNEELFSDFTTDYDAAKNLMLALERGEFPSSVPEENHQYIVQKLSARMKQSDFRFLPQKVKNLYELKRKQHQAMELQKQQQQKAMQSEYIPVDGPLIGCDIYVPDPTSKTPGVTRRARVPEPALKWLMQQLQNQSGALMGIQQADLGQLTNMAEFEGQMRAQHQAGQPIVASNGQGPAMPPMGVQ